MSFLRSTRAANYVVAAWLLAAAAGLAAAGPAAGQTFLPDDPLWEDPDRLDMPVPREQEVSEIGSLVRSTLGLLGTYDGPALNTNTLGEVPNSSWFTNRHGRGRMALEALQAGANQTGGPASGPWMVVGGGDAHLDITDARGVRYRLTFDPPGRRELSTAASVVAAKLLYALGYNVPEVYAVRFAPTRLRIGPDADVSSSQVWAMLRRAPGYSDDTRRALAVRHLGGVKDIGPFRFYGTRLDDGNDIFAHEGRRELRGLRVIAAWLNLTDLSAAHTRDVVVREEGRTFVRHYLAGLGAALGSGEDGPKERWVGHEYAAELWPALWRAGTLGFGSTDWIMADAPPYPAVGRFEAEHFEPERWKPRYPNPAFERAEVQDLFWAARHVMRFTNEELRAVVATAGYSDPAAARYVAETLAQRRSRIGVAYLGLGGGLDAFRAARGQLVYTDLLAQHQIHTEAAEQRRRGAARRIVWRVYDNEAEQPGAFLGEERATERPGPIEAVPIPLGEHAFLQASVFTSPLGRTDVFLRRTSNGYEVVGTARTEQEEE